MDESADSTGKDISAELTDWKAGETRQRIVVIGFWLIFGPLIPLLLSGLSLTVPRLFSLGRSNSTGDGFATELIRFCVIIGHLTLSVVILRNATTRYLRDRRAASLDEQLPATGVVDDRMSGSAGAGDGVSSYLGE